MTEFQRRLEANIRESLRFAVGEVQEDAVANMVAGVNAVLDHPSAPAPEKHVACPCTLIEQDEDCPVGYPSMLCGVCKGTGNTTSEQVTALACEMIKIAGDTGGPEDPFAAWESIDLLKSQHEKMRKALQPFAKFSSVLSATQQHRMFLQLLVCPVGDGHPDDYGQHIEAARAALATTEGK
ncbi:hypothetical protein [Rhizobium rhizophilum]|uniref:Uncharacterized protein n=1 Tax=Rhizobium rhizophilum TaxID=1850373 RepID=A0ABY2QWC1_9HYPH|nr:hypothetical protein [Rhizobium rhizophilum]THV13760.1 hypothetical protein E9677_12695 [Rhizobium rhizophilum]